MTPACPNKLLILHSSFLSPVLISRPLLIASSTQLEIFLFLPISLFYLSPYFGGFRMCDVCSCGDGGGSTGTGRIGDTSSTKLFFSANCFILSYKSLISLSRRFSIESRDLRLLWIFNVICRFLFV